MEDISLHRNSSLEKESLQLFIPTQLPKNEKEEQANRKSFQVKGLTMQHELAENDRRLNEQLHQTAHTTDLVAHTTDLVAHTTDHSIDQNKNKGAYLKMTIRNRKRYFGNRFSTWERNFFMILLLLNLCLAILIPVAYFYIIPSIIQSTLNDLGTFSSNKVVLDTFSIGSFQDDSMQVKVGMGIPSVVPLPVRAGLGETPVRVTDQYGNVIAETMCPPLDFWVNQEIKVSVLTNVSFHEQAQENLQTLLGQLVSGVPDLQIVVHLKAPITFFGLTLYSGLDLYKVLDLGHIETSVESVVGLLNRIASSISPASFSPAGKQLANVYSPGDVISLAESFSVVWSNLSVELNDDGLSSELKFSLENGSPFQVENVPGADFYVELQGIPIVRIVAHELSLKHGFQELILKIDVKMIDEKLEENAVANALERASLSYALSNDFVISIFGPVTMPYASFIHTITSKLRFDAPLSQILALNIGKSFAISDILSQAGIETILGNSSIALQVDSKSIKLPVDLALPNLAAIPRKFNFPYTTSIEAVGKSVSLMNIFFDPVSITRTNLAIFVNTSVNISPANSNQAALELANCLNPIFALKPIPGLIGIGNLVFSQQGRSADFKWPKVLFGGKNISIHLPALNKTRLFDDVLLFSRTLGISNSLSHYAAIDRVGVTELNDAPGFEVDGSLQILDSSILSKLQVNVGYFGMEATLESSTVTNLELPVGISISPVISGQEIAIKALAKFEESIPGEVTETLQKIVDRFLTGNHFDGSQYAGITGIQFGTSAVQFFVTFSKLIVDVSLGDLEYISGKLLCSLPPLQTTGSPIVKIKSADINVANSHSVLTTIETEINNPTKLYLGLGAISLIIELEQTTLMEILLSPVQVNPLNNNLNVIFSVEAIIHSSEAESAQKLGILVSDYMQDTTTSKLQIGVTGLKLHGTGAGSKIDFLSGIHFKVAAGSLIRRLNQGIKLASIIDLSAVIPSSDQILKDTHPIVSYALADASIGQGRMKVGVDFGYKNVIPVSLSVPLAVAEISLGNIPAFGVQVTGIDIERSSGTMRPRILLEMKKDSLVSENIGSIVNSIVNSQPLSSKIDISKIFFGTQLADLNNLFSEISFDITNSVSNLIQPLGKMVQDNSAHITLHGLEKRSPAPWAFSLIDTVSVKIDKADLVFSGDRSLKTIVEVSLGLPFPVDVNIPYIALNAYLQKSLVITPSFGLYMSGLNPVLNLEVVSEMHDSDDLANEIVQVVDVIFNGETSTQRFYVENISLGSSPNDTISSFSKVEIGVPADVILKPAHDEMLSLFNRPLAELLRSIDFKLNRLELMAIPNRSLILASPLVFKSGLIISLSGLQYIGVSLGLDGIPFTSVEIPSFSLKHGVNSFNLSLNAHFLSSDSIQYKVAEFVDHLQKHLGETDEILTVNGLVFGVNPSNPIKFLSRALIKLASSKIFTRDSINYFSKQILPSSLSFSDALKLDGLALDFTPEKVVKAGATGSTKSNALISLNFPFVKTDITVDSIDAFDISVSQLHISGNGPLAITSSVTVHDTDELANTVSNIVDESLHGLKIKESIGVRHIIFGASSTDTIDTFSKVCIQTGLEDILRPILNTKLNGSSYLNQISGSVSELNLKTAPNRSLNVSLVGKLQNGFSLTIKNLGFFGVSAGLNDFTPIFSVFGSVPNVIPGTNHLSLNSTVHFPSSPENRRKIAFIADEVYTGGFGSTKENITAIDLVFGASRDAAFRFLSKAAISVASSSVLTSDFKVYLLKLLGVDQGGNLTDLLSFSKAVINGAADPQSINFDIGFDIKKTGIQSKINLDYVETGIQLNDKLLLSSSLSKGFFLTTGIENSHFETAGKALFSGDLSVQREFGRIANALWSSSSLPGTIAIKGISFGIDSNPMNLIDAFSEISLKATIDSVYNSLKSEKISIPSINDVSPALLELDVYNENTLLVDWDVKVANISKSIKINLPYLRIRTYLDKSEFMDLSFSNFSLNGENIQGKVLVEFPFDSRVNQALIGGVSDILFHRAARNSYNYSISFDGLAFGPNREDAILALSEITGSTLLDSFVQEAANYFETKHPIEFHDIAAQLTVPGLEVNCAINPLSFPIVAKLNHVEIDIGWQVEGVGKVYEALHVKLDTINLPYFHVAAIPDLDPINGGFEPLQDLVLNMLQFREFLGNARFKNLKLVGSNGVVFTPYQSTLFAAPPSFFIPDPLRIELFPFQRPLKVALSVRNPSSLHLDLGRAKINLSDSSSGKVLISADSVTDIVAKNMYEGGNGTLEYMPTVALLTVPIFDIGGVLLDLPKLILRLIRMSETATFAVDVHLYRNGQDIKWVALGTQYLINHGLLEKLKRLIGNISPHLKISIVGKDPHSALSVALDP